MREKQKNIQNVENTLFPNRQESTPQENTEDRKGILNNRASQPKKPRGCEDQLREAPLTWLQSPAVEALLS